MNRVSRNSDLESRFWREETGPMERNTSSDQSPKCSTTSSNHFAGIQSDYHGVGVLISPLFPEEEIQGFVYRNEVVIYNILMGTRHLIHYIDARPDECLIHYQTPAGGYFPQYPATIVKNPPWKPPLGNPPFENGTDSP